MVEKPKIQTAKQRSAISRQRYILVDGRLPIVDSFQEI
jgi:hypothetical protein